jgi:hypothetical protein
LLMDFIQALRSNRVHVSENVLPGCLSAHTSESTAETGRALQRGQNSAAHKSIGCERHSQPNGRGHERQETEPITLRSRALHQMAKAGREDRHADVDPLVHKDANEPPLS